MKMLEKLGVCLLILIIATVIVGLSVFLAGTWLAFTLIFKGIAMAVIGICILFLIFSKNN